MKIGNWIEKRDLEAGKLQCEFTQHQAPENGTVKATICRIASMEGYNQPGDRKPQDTKHYLTLCFEGHKSHRSKNRMASKEQSRQLNTSKEAYKKKYY